MHPRWPDSLKEDLISSSPSAKNLDRGILHAIVRVQGALSFLGVHNCIALHCIPSAYILTLDKAGMSALVGNYNLLCEKVSELGANIVVAAVLAKGKAVASTVRPGILLPQGKALERILIQLEMLIGIPKTNESAFGKVSYVIVNHGSTDHMLFPLRDGHVMIISVHAPYPQELISQVRNIVDGATKQA